MGPSCRSKIIGQKIGTFNQISLSQESKFTQLLLKVEKYFFFPLQTTSYPLHTTTYASLCKTPLNSTKRLRVVCSEGPRMVVSAHATDPGTGEDDPSRLRPIGGNSGQTTSARDQQNRLSRYASKRSQTARNTIFNQYR